ncbi:hypothetical protein [Conexibacter arvalis]|uniref:Uncharacterized protein n=1 Tax=Conexibacter arvalis TaxID=912552 RepID=A0A840ICK8_9ACTN|nr:hypothetical protein [Conexibacter arvalis]MBB4662609.1 hypothetical protein [Conexibacter arvalis]
MSSDFEDRLERELVAAARREAEVATAAAARPRRVRRPGRLRPLPVAAVALLTIAALAVAVLALPGAEAPVPAPATGPTECERRAAAGELVLTAEPPPPRLLAAFAVLRRPQTDADRADCGVGVPERPLNPSAVRLAGRDATGGRVFVAPVGAVPDLDARRGGDRGPQHELPASARQPLLCVVIVGPSTGGGGCATSSHVGRGRFVGSSFADGVARVVGLFTDGIAAVELELDDGSTRRLEVRDNVATVQLRERPGERAASVVRYRLLDADGETIVTRRDTSILRVIEPPASNESRGARPR